MMDWQVRVNADDTRRGRLIGPDFEWPVVLGRSGVKPEAEKSEGDGATPLGIFALRRVFFRPDRVAPPVTRLRVDALRPEFGWCDDPAHSAYNRLVRRPFPARHEILWRDDSLYDVILVIGHNDDPVVRDRGSAVFVHCVRPDYGQTAGCVALDVTSLLVWLRLAGPGDTLTIRL